ncbi:MAG: hypothetical protein K9L86_07775 [Candidatus Omnitrophica bacterium]|nr:hypothetical protein [Candidatus Omnitrophota bacterium]
MDKQKQYESFLKSLRVALTNVSIYFKDHPIFVKSTQDLKRKIVDLFQFTSPLEVEITYNSLSCNGEQLKISDLVENVRNFLHQRKVKRIKIEKGVSVEDLTIFLQKVSLSPKDIVLNGGLKVILDQEKMQNIDVEDLDYSNLLVDESLEYKYSWFYLLRKGLKNNDTAKLQLLADTFEKMLTQFDIGDPVDLKELELIVGDFFKYLRQNDKNRFLGCLGAFVKLILESPQAVNLDVSKIKETIIDLEPDDLASIIFSKLESVKNFDSLNFNIFSKLVKRENHEKIANSLAKKLEQERWIKDNPQAIEKIKSIFSLPEDSYISEVYQHSLSSILSTISLGDGSSFDRKHLKSNYRLMLLDLLRLETEHERLDIVIDRILAELSDCFHNKDRDYVDKFIDVFQSRRGNDRDSAFFPSEIDQRISDFIEDVVFSSGVTFDFARLISIMQKSTRDYQFYLNKIFKEQPPNKYAFQIFFKFFSKETSRFCQQVKLNSSNVKLNKVIVERLKSINPQIALIVFKRIFAFSNKFIKLDILKTIQELKLYDEAFLFLILSTEKAILRKQAFLVLVEHRSARVKLARELLSLDNSFGIQTRLLKENMRLIDEKYFPEAKKYLVVITQYKFFWNRAVRRKANAILTKYGN